MLPPAVLTKVQDAIANTMSSDGDIVAYILTPAEIRNVASAAASVVALHFAEQTSELVSLKQQLRRQLKTTDVRRKYIVGPATAWEIADRILADHNVTREQLLEKETTLKFRRVRYEIYHTVYSTGKYGLETIGRIMNRNHASILNGINRWDEILQKEQNHD